MIRLGEEMFASGQPFSQGEVNIWMKKYAPKRILDKLAGKELVSFKLENDRMILGHSETGHHHVLEAVRPQTHISNAAIALVDKANDLFVDLKLTEDCKLVHQRSTDQHGAVILPAGDYVKAPREENTVEGWRAVKD